jgi:hypothetical protein
MSEMNLQEIDHQPPEGNLFGGSSDRPSKARRELRDQAPTENLVSLAPVDGSVDLPGANLFFSGSSPFAQSTATVEPPPETAQQRRTVEQRPNVQKRRMLEKPRAFERKRTAEKPRNLEKQPKVEQPRRVDQSRKVEQPRNVEQPQADLPSAESVWQRPDDSPPDTRLASWTQPRPAARTPTSTRTRRGIPARLVPIVLLGAAAVCLALAIAGLGGGHRPSLAPTHAARATTVHKTAAIPSTVSNAASPVTTPATPRATQPAHRSVARPVRHHPSRPIHHHARPRPVHRAPAHHAAPARASQAASTPAAQPAASVPVQSVAPTQAPVQSSPAPVHQASPPARHSSPTEFGFEQ